MKMVRSISVMLGAGVVAWLLPALPAAQAGATPASTPQLVFTTEPGTGAPGASLPDFVVTIEDSSGTTIASDTSTVSVTLNDVTNRSGQAPPASLTCAATAASAGVATFKGCSVDRGGLYTLTATDSGDSATSATSNSFFVSGPAQLLFTGQPGGGQAGVSWNAQPQVTVADANGNAVTGDTNQVGVAVVGGTGTPAAVLTCGGDNHMAAVSGVALFSTCSIDKTGSGYKLYAVDPTDQLISADSNPFDITAGTASQLVFTSQPSGGAGGAAMTGQPVVTVEDASGNPVVGNTDQISLSITSGTGTPGASLSCTQGNDQVTAVDGVATFGGCSIDRAGTEYTLTATDSASSLSVTSAAFGVQAGAATHLVFAVEPGGGSGGSAFATQPEVEILDAGNNPVPGVVTLSLESPPSGAALSCAVNPLGSNGVAQFAGCAVNDTGNDYVMTATSGTLSVQSDPFSVSPGGGAALSFVTEPDASTGGTAFPHQPVVKVTDSGGNPAAGSVTLSLNPTFGTPGAALSCLSSTVATDSNGQASFSGCAIDKAGQGYVLTATLSGTGRQPTASSTAFDITTGGPGRLQFTTEPGAGTGGTVLGTQPVVTVEDDGGNPISSSTATVALSITPGTGSGTLACTDRAIAATNGSARFTGCRIDRTASAYTLTATDGADGLSATSAPFAVTTGPASQLLFTSQPDGAYAGQAFAGQPVVTIADAGGNTVTGDTSAIGLAITAGTGSAGANLTCASDPADATAGVATFSGCLIDVAGGGYALTATDAADSLQAESLPLPVLLPPPGPLGAAPTSVPPAQTFGGRLYAINPTSVSDDVNSATGSLTWSTNDLTVAGVGEPFALTRSYNSADATGGSFGPGWTSIFDAGVQIAPDHSSATVRGEDGQQVVFTWDALTRSWVPPPGALSALSCNANFCTVNRFDGASFTAPPNGPIASFQNADGQGLTFTYGRGQITVAVETSGTALDVAVTLDSTGQVASVRTPAGRTVSYGYDSSGLLASYTDPDGHTWSYAYDGSGRLVGETVGGSTRMVAAYDTSSGRVSSISLQGSPKHAVDTFSWDPVARTATRNEMVDVNGSSSPSPQPYQDTYAGNVLVSQRDPAGAVTRYSYDANVDLIAVENPMGWVEQLTYDGDHNLVSQTDPISSTSVARVTLTYDTHHRVLTQTDADGNTSTYVYNGQLLGQFRPPGTSSSVYTYYTYNKLGELVQETTPLGIRLYSYDAAGNRTGTRLEDPKGNPLNGPGTLVAYDEAGHQVSYVDPRGNSGGNPVAAYQSTWSYDPAGNLVQSTTPGDSNSTNVTSYSYDAAGDLISTTDPAGTTTQRSWDESTLTLTQTVTAPSGTTTTTQTYDPSGNLLSQAQGGSRTLYAYDGDSRQIRDTSPANVTTQFAYDPDSNVVSATDSTGNTVTHEYDALDRPIRTVNDGQVTTTSYDPAGNVISSTNPGGVTTTATYTSHNKVASVTTPAGTTVYGYDAADDLVSTTEPNGHVTTAAYNGAGQRISTAVNGATTTYSFDSAGNIVASTDPDGRTTAFTLDAADKPIKVVYTESGQPTVTVTQSYDALGHRTSMTDASGTSSYSYDASGSLTSAVLPGGTSFSYDYSTPGQVKETYPDGTSISYATDDAQNLMSLQVGANPTSPGYLKVSYIRNAARQTTGIAFSNGLLESQSYDRAGDIVNQSLQTGGVTLATDSFTYSGGGQPLSQTDTVLNTTTASAYSYDAAGRIAGYATSTRAANTPVAPALTGTAPTSVSGTSPPVPVPTIDSAPSSGVGNGVMPTPAYSYDGAGNILSYRTSGGTTTSTYNGVDEVATQTGPNGTAVYTYDRRGDITSISTAATHQTFGYNAAAQLVSVTTNGVTVKYTYDGDGNRVTATTGRLTTRYVWDPVAATPQLALELTGSGSLIRRYIYGDGPVAMQTPTATYFYHLDPQGDVVELSDSTGNIAAAYHYDPYGNVTVSTPPNTKAPDNPLQFQGQYLDSATGLYNMRARNYDPAIGQFTQRDPLQSPAGVPAVTAYAFAGDQPTSLTDPTGRSAVQSAATTTFWGRSTVSANTLSDSKFGVSAIKIGIKAFAKGNSFLLEFKSAVSPSDLADARATEQAAGDVGDELSVIGIALQVGLTIDDCIQGTVTQCVADSVGLAVNIAFTVGCDVATEGAGSMACSLGGAALSFASSYVVEHYGPQLFAAFQAGTASAWVGLAFTVACTAFTGGVGLVACALAGSALVLYGPVIGAAFVTAGDAIAGWGSTAGQAVTTGFNQAGTAISSGFETAIGNLVGAGYSAAQLGEALAQTFKENIDQTVAALADLGYSLADITVALADDFAADAAQAAAALKSAFDYTASQIMGVLDSVYQLGDQAAATILAGLDYSVDEVAGALQAVYADAAAAAASVLEAVGYGVQQIGAALQQVYADADRAAAVVLAGLGYTADQVAGALEAVYQDAAAAAAAALQYAEYAVDQVAGALDHVYALEAQAAGAVLQGLGYAVDDLTTGLQAAYALTAQAVAQVLAGLAYTATEVAGALSTVYRLADAAVFTVLEGVGYGVDQIANALISVFSDAAGRVASLFQQAGYSLVTVADMLASDFSQTAVDVITTLEGIGNSAVAIGSAVADAFALGAQEVASDLESAGYAIEAIAQVLVTDFYESAQLVAQTLKNLGYQLDAIAGLLKNFFDQTDVEAAAILNAIGEDLSALASELESLYNESAGAVASVLSDIGISTSTIDAIGGAFSSFGSDLQSGWDTVKSWF